MNESRKRRRESDSGSVDDGITNYDPVEGVEEVCKPNLTLMQLN